MKNDSVYRTALAAELRNAGFDPIECATAMEALDVLDRTPSIRLAVISDSMPPPRTPNFLSFTRMMKHRNSLARIVLISQLNETSAILDDTEKDLFEDIVERVPDVRIMTENIVRLLGT